MRRAAAVVWLAIVLAAVGYLAFLIRDGLPLRTDILALIPREERDPAVQRATEAVSRSLGRRIIVLVGDNDAARARAAAMRLKADLSKAGVVDLDEGAADHERLSKLGAFYFPHRQGLLSDEDRELLRAGRGQDVSQKALAQAFGVGGVASAGLLRSDPFLLLPSFFAGLPVPLSRLTLDEGMLSTVEGRRTWVLVSATLRGEAYEIDVQKTVVAAFDASATAIRTANPGLEVRRLGAVFFADHGARTAIAEASTLSTISLVATVVMLLVVFRRVQPLLHNVLALAVGLCLGFAGSFLIFGELHVAALLLGTSLNGVAVDYGLHYSAAAFDRKLASGGDRLRKVMPAISLGLATTLIGYAALAIAPLPGLRQIAVFSAIGLSGAFLTVVLWFPLLDRVAPLGHGTRLLRGAGLAWSLWTHPRWYRAQLGLLAALVAIGALGVMRYGADDDVRRLQALSPDLLREQADIQRLIGATAAPQFLLVRATDDEAALQVEEALSDQLARLKREGAIAGYQMPAAFVPSAGRQAENRALVEARLVTPLLAGHLAALGLASGGEPPKPGLPLTLGAALQSGALPFLKDLVIEPGLHVVAMQGVSRPDLVRAAIAGQPMVRFVDPVADFSELLGRYRARVVAIVLVSAVLIYALLAWRYGWRGAAWVIMVPLIAMGLVPAVISAVGEPFTFFHAIGLALILAIGVDYAIFCAEHDPGHQDVTMLSVWLVTLTTLLSFGLLGLSGVPAVRAFGVTMLIGITVAFFLAPLASRAGMRRPWWPRR